MLPDRLDLTTYSAGAEFAYEADFWLRDRSTARAAGAESLAAESDLHTARIRVLADTVGTYFEVVDLRHQRKLAGEIVELLKEWEWLMQTRYDGGLVGAEDLYAARRRLVLRQVEKCECSCERFLVPGQARRRRVAGPTQGGATEPSAGEREGAPLA